MSTIFIVSSNTHGVIGVYSSMEKALDQFLKNDGRDSIVYCPIHEIEKVEYYAPGIMIQINDDFYIQIVSLTLDAPHLTEFQG